MQRSNDDLYACFSLGFVVGFSLAAIALLFATQLALAPDIYCQEFLEHRPALEVVVEYPVCAKFLN
jgi:hypothetical protein